jgi:leucyl-tRNA synthetase
MAIEKVGKSEEGIDFLSIEKKWQKKWDKEKAFKVSEDKKKKKYYVLEMYPYPSAAFLHMGHVRNFTIGDVYARFKRMSGFNVLYPMGYDSFGLPAETAAKKAGIHPKKYAEDAIAKIMEYQKACGNSYDWDRVLASHDEDYYKWNQYFFLKLLEKGLAYRGKAPVNWCETCQSVLANEEAEGGKCWRCNNEVVKKDLEQWFFKITDYADRLLSDLDKIEWPERIKTMQKNWIGRKEGYMQYYKVNDMKLTLSTFTTHHHTSYAEIFIAIAPEHPIALELVKGTKYEKGALEFIKEVSKNKMSGKFTPESAKEGYFTGRYAKDFCSGRDLPIYIADFALIDFGTGIVKASCHDKRDYDFAKTHGIKMYEVLFPNKLIEKSKNKKEIEYDIISPGLDDAKLRNWAYNGEYNEKKIGNVKVLSGNIPEITLNIAKDVEDKALEEGSAIRQLINVLFKDKKIDKLIVKNENLILNMQDMEDMGFVWSNNAYQLTKGDEKVPYSYDGQGYMFDSGKFIGLSVPEAKKKMGIWMEKEKYAKKNITYSLRDWLISRQRYWGTPIPIVYCDKCGVVPVHEKELPVRLPEKVDFKVTGNPLNSAKDWINVKCPKCKGKSKRETDTMGGFVDSSWYFLRYCDNLNKKEAFDKKKVEYWMPVDQYIGGAEHAVMHLMYARFFVKALKDLGIVKFDEPFKRLFNQGIVYKDGAKMSKSYGNVVFQTDISEKYGIDTARLFLMFVGSPDKQMEWSDDGVEGAYRVINRLIRLKDKISKGKASEKEEHRINKTIKIVSEGIESFDYPKAVVSLIGAIDYFNEGISKEGYKILLKLISPFCPHTAEEMWESIGGKGFISLEEWPKADESKINEKIEQMEKNVDKTVSDILNVLKIVKEKSKKDISKIYLYAIPNETSNYNEKVLSNRLGLSVKVFAVNDKNKYDPESKSSKAKPGKPGIFVE